MAETTYKSSTDGNPSPPTQSKLPSGWLSTWPWVTFLLPFIVFMVATSFEPKPPRNFGAEQEKTRESEPTETLGPDDRAEEGFFAADAGGGFFPAISYSYYPQVYTAKIVLTLLAIALVWPGYRTFPLGNGWLGVSGLSIVVGVAGVVLWITLCHLRFEPKVIGPIDEFLGSFIPGLEPGDTPTIGLMSILGTGERSAFNPLEQLANTPAWAYVFLAIRFMGLAVIVPVIEEFFLRGFMMRFVVHEQWWQVPIGTVNRVAIIAGTAVPMLMHPGELLAAFVWFSIVTWLMVHTRNIWDCVVAHAVTNLLLGIYVVWFDQWQLM